MITSISALVWRRSAECVFHTTRKQCHTGEQAQSKSDVLLAGRRGAFTQPGTKESIVQEQHRSELAALNARLGLPGHVHFESSARGGPVVVLDHPRGRATVALMGAQLIDWQPAGQEPVFWLSPVAQLDTGSPVRGGVPVCWPWFGPPAPGLVASTGRTWPQHGFARTAMWLPIEAGEGAEGPWVTLALEAPADAGKGWPHQAQARLTVVVGAKLELRLRTHNRGPEPLVLTQALHAYFKVGDITRTRIDGLSGHVFHDTVAHGPARAISPSLNSQNGAVTFSGEIDRIYLEQRGAISIVDEQLGRQITMTKRGSGSTVVWNPWRDKSDGLGDMGAEGYRGMVCVEAADTIYDALSVPAGGTTELAASYACEPLRN